MGEKKIIDVEYLQFFWPMRHFLITCGDIEKESNIIAVSFCMPVSKEPPLVACAVGFKAYTCDLIKEYREFIVNVPLQDLKPQIYYCGYHSGRQGNKFRMTGLTPVEARKVKAPVIRECVAHMECIVRNESEAGDKILFIGEVVEAYANEDIVKCENIPQFAKGEFPRKVYGNRFG